MLGAAKAAVDNILEKEQMERLAGMLERFDGPQG